MKSQPKMLFVFLTLTLAINQACAGLAAAPTATPTAAPTNTPAPTKTALPVLTTTPVISQNEVEFGSPVKHQSGAFEYAAPVGWDVNEYSYSVYLSPGDTPEDRMKITISINVENTGYELDAEAFQNYVNTTESIWYGSQENYSLISRHDEEATTITVKKSFTDSNGDQIAFSSYNQTGSLIYTAEIYAKAELFDQYTDLFLNFINSLVTSGDNMDSAPIYYSTSAYEAPNQAYTMDVPASWAYLSGNF